MAIFVAGARSLSISSRIGRRSGTPRLRFAEARAAGATTLMAIADALNARGVKTAQGKLWRAQQVKNVIGRGP